jgi:hypothetical protein
MVCLADELLALSEVIVKTSIPCSAFPDFCWILVKALSVFVWLTEVSVGFEFEGCVLLDESEVETFVISTSCLSAATSAPSKSEALLFNGDDDLCDCSAAPPIIAFRAKLPIGDRLRRVLVGASEDPRCDATDTSASFSLSMERPAYAALGELAAEELQSGPEKDGVCRYEGMGGRGRAGSELGVSKRGGSSAA